MHQQKALISLVSMNGIKYLYMSIPEIYRIFLETTGVSTDSRTIKSGNFYIALSGQHFDGNNFAEEAIDRGASFSLVESSKYTQGTKRKDLEGKIIEVDNTLVTLQDLATYHRRQFSIPVLAITGTNGKTTTKELVADVLQTKYRIVKTEENLNNHIGVPLTLLRIAQTTEIVIVEMGASHLLDIAELCAIAEPTHGVITNIGTAHLEGFGSKAGVTEAKSKLYEWLRDHQGTVFVNKNDKDLTGLIYRIDSHQFLNNVWYGDKQPPLNKNLFGDFNKENMKTAMAIGEHFEVRKVDIKKALQEYEFKSMRSEQINTARENKIILDAYNANPSSMKASLEAFAKFSTPKTKWVVLGDMKELGESTEREHRELLWEISRHGFTNVILIGEELGIANQASKKYAEFKTLEECLRSYFLRGIKKSVVLIKGSHSMKLWELVKEL